MRKRVIVGVALLMFLIAIGFFCTMMTEHREEPSYENVTLQIYNTETKTWDTYQGTLDYTHGLYGDWKYEVLGRELVLSGARLIGKIPADN